MKVLVLGGTGAMGVHLVQLLSQKGFETIVSSRGSRPPSNNIRFVQGNAQNRDFLNSLLAEHWDVIVDFMVYSTSIFKERVADLLAATSQYIFISTARVFADSIEPLMEDSDRLLNHCLDQDFLSTDEYSLTKARQEDLLKSSGKVNWTIIRPYISYDTYRLQLGVLEKEEWLYRALKGRTVVFSRDIADKVTTLTSGSDVARCICALVGKPQALGETFNITTDEPVKWEDVLSLYERVLTKHLGTKPKVILQDMETFLRSKPAHYQIKYDRLYHRRFDCSKIYRSTETKDFIDPVAGLQSSLEEFLKKPKFELINWRDEAVRDKQTGEWAHLKEITGIKQKLKYLAYRIL